MMIVLIFLNQFIDNCFTNPQDCNKDGVINCDDYAHIHILGGFGCAAPVDKTPFYKDYSVCRSQVASLSGK